MKHELNTDGKKREWWSIGVMGGTRLRSGAMEGGGGQEAGKWTGFSHLETAFSDLFPHKSMQVVDFPHICTVRVFLRDLKQSNSGRGMIGSGMTPLASWAHIRLARLRRVVREKLRIVTGKSAKFHESPRKFAQIRPVNPRCYALLRVGAFFGESTIGPSHSVRFGARHAAAGIEKSSMAQ